MPDAGMATLDSMIERLKRLGSPQMPEDVARRAAPLVEAAIQKTAAAGTTPLGQEWKRTKKGTRPLQHAASRISARATGRLVLVTLTGPDVFHHRGSKRNPRRQVLPDGASTPKAVYEACIEAARRVFRELGGRL
jgi:hypothetical protein